MKDHSTPPWPTHPIAFWCSNGFHQWHWWCTWFSRGAFDLSPSSTLAMFSQNIFHVCDVHRTFFCLIKNLSKFGMVFLNQPWKHAKHLWNQSRLLWVLMPGKENQLLVMIVKHIMIPLMVTMFQFNVLGIEVGALASLYGKTQDLPTWKMMTLCIWVERKKFLRRLNGSHTCPTNSQNLGSPQAVYWPMQPMFLGLCLRTKTPWLSNLALHTALGLDGTTGPMVTSMGLRSLIAWWYSLHPPNLTVLPSWKHLWSKDLAAARPSIGAAKSKSESNWEVLVCFYLFLFLWYVL